MMTWTRTCVHYKEKMMNNEIIENGDVVYYAVRVNGTIVGPKHSSPLLAEAAITHLNEEQQSVAEVVPVTADGKELLLG